MARLIYGMNMSLDGYVDHDRFAPDPVLFRHFVEQARGLAGSIYGRRLYELMAYWDEDHPEWSPDERDFALAWRRQPKWVVSRTLAAVGPNATLVAGEAEAAIRRLKDTQEGEIEVGGTVLADFLSHRGLIDEYLVYLHPAVLGSGKPFFRSPPPPLRLVASDRIGPSAVRLCYVPA